MVRNRLVVAAAAALLWAGAALGQSATAPTPEIQREYDAAFAAMIADPGNLDKTFRFAGLAVQADDLEGAVAALERMLIVDPNLPRVRLELGLLYYRLGSFDVARVYIVSALQSPTVPDPVRARAEQVLAQIDAARSVHKIFGSVQVGIRYQTNALAAPAAGLVRVNGVDANLTTGTARGDTNVFAVGTFTSLYDLEDQDATLIETRGTVFQSMQFKQAQVNLLVLSANTGPRFKFLQDFLAEGTLRPAVGVDYVRLDDTTNYYAAGGGLELTHDLSGFASLTWNGDFRRRTYNNTRSNTAADDRDASEFAFRVSADKPLLEWLSLNLALGSTAYRAKAEFETYAEYSASIGFNFQVPGLSLTERQPGALLLSGAYVETDYDKPDPAVDPNRGRHDREKRASVTATIPVNDWLAMIGQAGVARRDSTLRNFEYTNTFGMFALAGRF